MNINYWACGYNEYDEFWDGVNEERFYGCGHKLNDTGLCVLKRIHTRQTDDCPFLDQKTEE